jgi:hypothetical protein
MGCSDADKVSDSATGMSLADAESASPIGMVCEFGNIENVFVPANRGRGNNNGTWVEVDNRTYEPAYLYGDVNYDGVAGTRDDAMLAVKQIYVKQIDSEPCPAVADIGIFPQGSGADGFYTAEDIYQWNQIKTGKQSFQFSGQVICESECQIQNHMSPQYKHK